MSKIELKKQNLQTNYVKCNKKVYVKIQYQNKMQVKKERAINYKPGTIYGLYQKDTINGGYRLEVQIRIYQSF